MPNTDLLALWVTEVNTELKERKDKHDELRIDFTRLETQVKTRNRIIYTLSGLFLAAAGTVIALISIIQHLK